MPITIYEHTDCQHLTVSQTHLGFPYPSPEIGSLFTGSQWRVILETENAQCSWYLIAGGSFIR